LIKQERKIEQCTLINMFVYSIYRERLFYEAKCNEVRRLKKRISWNNIYIYEREKNNSRNHKLKRKSSKEHHNDTLSKNSYGQNYCKREKKKPIN